MEGVLKRNVKLLEIMAPGRPPEKIGAISSPFLE